MEGNRRPKAYYAAGLFNQGERAFNLEVKAVLDDLGYETWFPQENAGFLEDLIEKGMTLAQARHHIFEINLEAVRGSDLLLFLLDGRVPDEGACIEAGVAFGLGKRCIGLKTDFRNVEPGGNNLMIDGVLDYKIAADLEELRKLLSDEMTVIDLRNDDVTINLQPLENPYVAVAGPLGVGKTSLISLLSKNGKWTVLPEPITENPYLSEAYTNLTDLGFRMQTFYLGQRAQQHMSSRNMGGPLIQERCLREDGEVFAPAYRDHGAYDENDLANLLTLYQGLVEQVPEPDLTVYLTAPFDITVDRIRRRDRVAERDLDLGLVRAIYDRYEKWALDQPEQTFLRIDTEDLDYTSSAEAAFQVVGRINDALTKTAVGV